MTDAEGKPVLQHGINLGGLIHLPREMTLATGKEVKLAEVKHELRPASEWATNVMPSALFATGKISVQYYPGMEFACLRGVPDATSQEMSHGHRIT